MHASDPLEQTLYYQTHNKRKLYFNLIVLSRKKKKNFKKGTLCLFSPLDIKGTCQITFLLSFTSRNNIHCVCLWGKQDTASHTIGTSSEQYDPTAIRIRSISRLYMLLCYTILSWRPFQRGHQPWWDRHGSQRLLLLLRHSDHGWSVRESNGLQDASFLYYMTLCHP